MNRRYFLMGAAAASVAPRASLLASPNDTVRVACVGVHAQGREHIAHYAKMPNVEIAAVCDIDESVLNARLADIEKLGHKRPAGFTDFRKLIEDQSIDAVSIATPNHHHTLQTIWACQAGKDVYVEKPCSHDMFEARQISVVMEKYGRIVQHGTNSRSGIAREAVGKIHAGLVGDVYMARGLCFKWRDTIGRAPVAPVPAGVHYDLWLGPAPLHAFTQNRFHYKWHWFWDYGNGDFGNQGIHQLDVARWGLGVTYPTKVSAMGGHVMFDDDQETPNVLAASFEFDAGGKKKLLNFEVRHWITNHEAGMGESGASPNTVGTVFYGPKGYVAIWDEDHGRYESFLGKEQSRGPSGVDIGNNWANFIAAVRSRKRSDLNAPIEEGAISTVLLHLANISYRVGRTLYFDPQTFSCKGDAEANAYFRRSYRPEFTVPEIA
ncbi:MAG: Gfo/Idh/MocA family oxidoreductase [Bryobacteraceae bacterium]|jgi:predicted dehydrogenase